MGKFQNLIKENQLAETLMADKDFVEEAKKILSNENIEVSEAKLSEIMQEIEKSCNNSLTEQDLQDVSGGITKKKAASVVIRTASTVIGTFLGGRVGTNIGAGIGYTVGKNGEMGPVNGLDGKPLADKEGNILKFDQGAVLGAGYGTMIGAPSGMSAGAVGGYKFGAWVCKKLGLND